MFLRQTLISWAISNYVIDPFYPPILFVHIEVSSYIAIDLHLLFYEICGIHEKKVKLWLKTQADY